MKNLKKVRLENGLTQSELAKKIGVSRRVISNYEQTRSVDRCFLNRILDISMALDCRMEDILDDAELIEKVRRYDNRGHS